MELPTYTSIRRIEKRLYKLYDFRLPMPLPVGQIAVYAAVTVPCIALLTLFGLPFNHNLFWLYVLPLSLLTRLVLESGRLPVLLTSQLRYIGERSPWCRMAPLAEEDEAVAFRRLWRGPRAVCADAGRQDGAICEQDHAIGGLTLSVQRTLLVATPAPWPTARRCTWGAGEIEALLELAAPLPPGVSGLQLGWNRNHFLSLESEQLAGVAVWDAHHTIVTQRVIGRMMKLGVPVYAVGGMGISGESAWLPASRPTEAPSPSPIKSDAATKAALMLQLPASFTAYASGDQATLGWFLAPGTLATGLGGAVTAGSVTGVTAPAGGPVRHIATTIVRNIPGTSAKVARAGCATASLQSGYGLTIVSQRSTWYFQGTAPSSQAGGQR